MGKENKLDEENFWTATEITRVQSGPCGFYTGNLSVQYDILETIESKTEEFCKTASRLLKFPVLKPLGPGCTLL